MYQSYRINSVLVLSHASSGNLIHLLIKIWLFHPLDELYCIWFDAIHSTVYWYHCSLKMLNFLAFIKLINVIFHLSAILWCIDAVAINLKISAVFPLKNNKLSFLPWTKRIRSIHRTCLSRFSQSRSGFLAVWCYGLWLICGFGTVAAQHGAAT